MSYGSDLVPPGMVTPPIIVTRQYLPVTGPPATWAAAASRISRAVMGRAVRACARGAVAPLAARGGVPGAADTRTATAAPTAVKATPAVTMARFMTRRA